MKVGYTPSLLNIKENGILISKIGPIINRAGTYIHVHLYKTIYSLLQVYMYVPARYTIKYRRAPSN